MFEVKVRKAKGRSVAGGSRMGNMEGFEGSSGGLLSRIGCTGVPKAGEEEGIGSGPAGVGSLRNRGAVRGALIAFSIVYYYALYENQTRWTILIHHRLKATVSTVFTCS